MAKEPWSRAHILSFLSLVIVVAGIMGAFINRQFLTPFPSMEAIGIYSTFCVPSRPLNVSLDKIPDSVIRDVDDYYNKVIIPGLTNSATASVSFDFSSIRNNLRGLLVADFNFLMRACGTWTISVNNAGRLAAQNVEVSVPGALYCNVIRGASEQFQNLNGRTISLGDIRPRESIKIISWTSEPYAPILNNQPNLYVNGELKKIQVTTEYRIRTFLQRHLMFPIAPISCLLVFIALVVWDTRRRPRRLSKPS